MARLYEFEAVTLAGPSQRLSDYRGQVLLVVNVASLCGFAPQYEGLETLYRKYRDQGFTVLAFPCDQFGHQEPGDAAEIRDFCTTKYNVTFPLFAKIAVNGGSAHPLYQFLKSACPGFLGTQAIKWNFTKFLIDRQGNVVARFGPTTSPERIERTIVRLLAEKIPSSDPTARRFDEESVNDSDDESLNEAYD